MVIMYTSDSVLRRNAFNSFKKVSVLCCCLLNLLLFFFFFSLSPSFLFFILFSLFLSFFIFFVMRNNRFIAYKERLENLLRFLYKNWSKHKNMPIPLQREAITISTSYKKNPEMHYTIQGGWKFPTSTATCSCSTNLLVTNHLPIIMPLSSIL